MKNIIKIISTNKIIILPTDTIYGISGNRQNYNIIYKILSIKKRFYNSYFSIIINSINKLFLIIKNLSQKNKNLITKFFPGEYTIILKKYNIYKKKNNKTIAIRIPKILKIKILLKNFSGLISTSINENNILQMINVKIIKNFFNTKINYILKKNSFIKGLESKIISSINNKIINRNKIKNLKKKNKKLKHILIKKFFLIYNIIFYINIIKDSYNILYNKKNLTQIKLAKQNKKHKLKKYKNIITTLNIMSKNYGNIIIKSF
ncbi:MAG: Sua5/YciO/YrdC/YwlC family protein [Candidatus Azosocius agrarius]|nr:MAG: Sua5/YciO/YrdC/YwlC family protein [Gammaproteobacteria bacterium]